MRYFCLYEKILKKTLSSKLFTYFMIYTFILKGWNKRSIPLNFGIPKSGNRIAKKNNGGKIYENIYKMHQITDYSNVIVGPLSGAQCLRW